MRVFGCLAMAHIPKDARAAIVKKNTPPEERIKRASNIKLTPRALISIFVNYHRTGYVLIDPIKGTKIHTSDIQWFENKMFKHIVEEMKNPKLPDDIDTLTEDDSEILNFLDDYRYLGDHTYATAMFTETNFNFEPSKLNDKIPRSYRQAMELIFAE